MKNIAKIIYEFSCLFIETIISILSVLFFSSYRVPFLYRKLNKRIDNNDVCYILCNGPSLQSFFSNTDTSNKHIFVVNFFASSDKFADLKPDNYIVLDNILIGRAILTENTKKKVLDLYEKINSVTWPMVLYFPNNGDLNMLNKVVENKNVRICIYNMTPVDGLKTVSHFLYRLNLGMPRPQNISNAAIFCAINSGYKKIYLFGVEHSWLKNFDVNPDNHRIFVNDSHFYQLDNIRYYKKGEYLRSIINISKAFKSHFLLRRYADSRGAAIVNKTVTSFIEAYEFTEYK